MKRTILTTAAVFAALFFVASANAATYYFTDHDSDQDWHNSNNWFTDCLETSAGSIPGTNDRAVICPGAICDLTASDEVESIEVDGTLNIQPGTTLTLNNGSSSDSVVDGTVALEASGTYGKLALKTANHTFTGSGTIAGGNVGCQITLDTNNQVLTNSVTISGALAITKSGSPTGTSFVNSGKVRANTAGTLDIQVESSGSGEWRAEATNAILQFQVSPSSLAGPFYLSYGKLKVLSGIEVSTTGDLATFDYGATIELAGSSASFAFNQPS